MGTAQPSAAAGSPTVMTRKITRGHGHAADRGDNRQHGLRRPREGPDGDLALELEPGDEEEDREQPVGGPLLHGQVHAERRAGRRRSRARSRTTPCHGEFAHTSATTVAATRISPPTVSCRSAASDEGTVASIRLVREGARARGWARGSSGHRRTFCRPDFPAHLRRAVLATARTRAGEPGWSDVCSRPTSGRWVKSSSSLRRLEASPDQVHHRRVGQRGDVAELAVLGDVPQQAAHDLAGPGLGQLGDDQDLARLGDRRRSPWRRGCAAPGRRVAARSSARRCRAGSRTRRCPARSSGRWRRRRPPRRPSGATPAPTRPRWSRCCGRTRASRRRPGRAARSRRPRPSWRRRRRSTGPGSATSRSPCTAASSPQIVRSIDGHGSVRTR